MIDVLIPTYRRKTGLAVTLASLFGQTYSDYNVTIADQTPENERYTSSEELATICDAMRFHGHSVRVIERPVGR